MSKTRAFKRLSPVDVMDPNYDRTLLANHAFRVFLFSYPELNSQMLSPNHPFAKKLEKYVQVICDLYAVDKSQLNDLYDFEQEVSGKDIAYLLTVAVKAFKGRDRVQNSEFEITNRRLISGKVTLDINSEVQKDRTISSRIDFEDVRRYRGKNRAIKLRFAGNRVNIGIGQIHPEGYQQWIEFGEGVELLIEMTLIIADDYYGEEPEDFHLHTLGLMVEKRLSHYEVKRQNEPDLSRPVVWHKRKTRNNVISFERPLVEPNTDQYFWGTFNDWKQKLRQNVESERRISVRDVVLTQVKYLDIQASTTYGDEIEGYVCLCNEWCNWNAFFHFNPIYRFIIVQNQLLFLQFCHDIPAFYLFASAHPLEGRSVNRHLLLSLIGSAHDNRAHYKDRINKSNKELPKAYQVEDPMSVEIIGNVYKFIWPKKRVVKLCQQLDVNPFADICVDAIVSLIKVLSDLHNEITASDKLVKDEDEWERELEGLCVGMLGFFFVRGYQEAFRLFNIRDPTGNKHLLILLKDRVFGSDFEYLYYFPKNDSESDIKNLRLKALQWGRAVGQSTNALNVLVTIDPFVHHYIQAFKFFNVMNMKFTKTDPDSEEDALERVNDYCLDFDEDFGRKFKKVSKIEIKISEAELNASGLTPDKQQWIYGFYSLKLYSFGFRIQKHCIESRFNHLMYIPGNPTQIADKFRFIFDISMMEVNAIDLFSSVVKQNELFKHAFDHFYEEFWQKATHETTQLPKDPDRSKVEVFSSTCQQFRKLYVWMKNNGNQRQKFVDMIRLFNIHLKKIFDRSIQIESAFIIPAIVWLGREKGFELDIEVMDVLAVYLVRANCVCLLKAIHTLFRKIHSLQLRSLCKDSLAFSLCKPGWVQLLRTGDPILFALITIRNRYIVFDDEIERIADTLDDSRRLCKMFYRLMYNKLLSESFAEMSKTSRFFSNLTLTKLQRDLLDESLTLQFVVTFALCVAFVDHFREDFDVCRKKLYRLHKRIAEMYFKMKSRTNKVKLSRLKCFGSMLTPLSTYMSDSTAIRAAHPFDTTVWTDFFTARLAHLTTLDANDVKLDMTAADQVI